MNNVMECNVCSSTMTHNFQIKMLKAENGRSPLGGPTEHLTTNSCAVLQYRCRALYTLRLQINVVYLSSHLKDACKDRKHCSAC